MIRTAPIQQRATTRLETLTTAATELIDEYGREYVTTAMIADRAGCSIGTFYRYFDDIHAILKVVQPIDRYGVSRVLELHRRDPGDSCYHDSEVWPCSTVQALVGEADA